MANFWLKYSQLLSKNGRVNFKTNWLILNLCVFSFIADIRLQLNEQLRCLDVRMESQVSLIQELQDFFRRRGEVELDYSKSLDKLAKTLQLRHKEQKQKREQWPMFSSYTCWTQLVNQTKSLSKDHATLAEIYSTHLVARLQAVCEDVQRIYRKVILRLDFPTIKLELKPLKRFFLSSILSINVN